MRIPESELILNNDGSVYHLNLLPEDIGETIFIVGDPDRVPAVSRYFDAIEIKKQKREFVTHTGFLNRQKVTVLSTGISTANIEIVFNELDALVNIDLKTREAKSTLHSLSIIRIGTAGALQEDIPVDSFVISKAAIGLDGLNYFYENKSDTEEIYLKEKFTPFLPHAYAVKGNAIELIDKLAENQIVGTTVTCPGFYSPQGRLLRIPPKIQHLTQQLTHLGMANFEMETAGIYLLGKVFGHYTCSISAIVANRCTHQFSAHPYDTIDSLIRFVLETVAQTPKIA